MTTVGATSPGAGPAIEPTKPAFAARRVAPLLLGVLIAAMNAPLLFLVLPTLGRELGFAEWRVGLLFSAAALMSVLNGPIWGRRADTWGRKAVFQVGILGYALDMALLALIAWAGLQGWLPADVVFAGLLILRLLSGVFASGTVPSSQAYIVDVTSEQDRTAGLALLGSMSGLALILGPAVGAALGSVSLLLPALVPAVAGLLNALWVWRGLPEPVRRRAKNPPRLRPTDARVWPFLLIGLLTGLGLSGLQATLAFLVQDRLGVAAAGTIGAAGFAILVAGLTMVVVQVGIVRRLNPSAVTMLRVGFPLAVVGFVVLAAADSLLPILAAMVVAGAGFGLVFPGFQAAPTLLVEPEEQGALGGLSFAAIAASYIVGPLLMSLLYGLRPEVPYLFGAGLFAALIVFVLVQPTVRQADRRRGGRAAESMAARPR